METIASGRFSPTLSSFGDALSPGRSTGLTFSADDDASLRSSSEAIETLRINYPPDLENNQTASINQITKLGGHRMLANKSAKTSSGVLIHAPGGQILLGKATGTFRWDIPKGLVEPGEEWPQAAARELEEETGIVVAAAALTAVGHYNYLPGKNLVLFAWRPPSPIDPAGLRCRSTFTARDGRDVPELERFAFFARDQALGHVGTNMARVLASLDWARVFAQP